MLSLGQEIEVFESTLEGRKFKVKACDSLNLSKKEMAEFWSKTHNEEGKVSEGPLIANNACAIPIEGVCDLGDHGILRKLLINRVHDSAYGSFIVRATVDFKWRTYAKDLLVEELAHHCFVSLSFTVYCFMLIYGGSNKIDPEHEHEANLKLKSISLLVCSALAVPCLFRELCQCIVYSANHRLPGFVYWLTSAWNWIEVFSYINVVFIIPSGQWVFLNEGTHREILSALVAVESLLIWSRMLFYARPFEHTGSLVVTISAIVREICYFLILALSVMFGFALAFCVLYRHVEPRENHETDVETSDLVDALYNQEMADEEEDKRLMHEAFGTFRRSFFTVFSYTFGDFEMDILYKAPEPVTALILFVLYVVIIAIILLNMLIALMSEEFARINEKKKTQIIEARAKAIDDIDSMLSTGRREELGSKIGRYLQVIIPTHHYERVTKGCRLRHTPSKARNEMNTDIKRNLHEFGKTMNMTKRFASSVDGRGLTWKGSVPPSPVSLDPIQEDVPASTADVEDTQEEKFWYDSDGTDSNFSFSYSDEDAD